MGGPKKPRPDYKLMKQTYEGWIEDLDKWYESELSSTRARLGASGVTKDSDLWKQTMGEVESTYQERLDEIYGSQTYKMVQEYITAVTGRVEAFGGTFDPETFKATGMNPRKFQTEEERLGMSSTPLLDMMGPQRTFTPGSTWGSLGRVRPGVKIRKPGQKRRRPDTHFNFGARPESFSI